MADRPLTTSELNDLRERTRVQRRAWDDLDTVIRYVAERETHERAAADARRVRAEEDAATEQHLSANAKRVADSDAATAAHVAANAEKVAAANDATKAAQLRQQHAEEQARQAETWLADAEAKRRKFRASIEA